MRRREKVWGKSSQRGGAALQGDAECPCVLCGLEFHVNYSVTFFPGRCRAWAERVDGWGYTQFKACLKSPPPLSLGPKREVQGIVSNQSGRWKKAPVVADMSTFVPVKQRWVPCHPLRGGP